MENLISMTSLRQKYEKKYKNNHRKFRTKKLLAKHQVHEGKTY